MTASVIHFPASRVTRRIRPAADVLPEFAPPADAVIFGAAKTLVAAVERGALSPRAARRFAENLVSLADAGEHCGAENLA